jgi:hypothetical protein
MRCGNSKTRSHQKRREGLHTCNSLFVLTSSNPAWLGATWREYLENLHTKKISMEMVKNRMK